MERQTLADKAADQIFECIQKGGYAVGDKMPTEAQLVQQEMTDPCRNLATSVALHSGTLPLVSVRLTAPIPKARIFDVMAEINAQSLNAPTAIGQVVIADVLGLGADVVVTKNAKRA